ncbi:MAG: fumarate hydratase [Fusobacteriaceae bacterium]
MREINMQIITQEVERLCIEANYHIEGSILNKIKRFHANEESSVAKNVLEQIIKNDEIASSELLPMCQDTGLVVVFLEVGTEVKLNGDIYEAVQEGVRKGYKKGYLRNSIVRHPFDRVNTKDNTPAVIHTKLITGSDKIKIVVAPKGGGSENMSIVRMMKPSDGIEGVKKFVLETIKNAGGNPCPPIIVGVGIGGSFEKAALIAKEALMREIDDESPDLINAQLEKELLIMINKSGIGPLGLGGRTTALAVKVETYPCHIASLPVAINLNCHAARHKEVVL